jgi:3-methylcrotonyl-CoA carboxylase alpha subunit
MIRSVLIANRGEIACRVIRTARRMGIRTIAVYSEADRDALHVREADMACFIGPAAADQSYLKFEAIVSIAKETGAEAIHPGYGFLAENADFAQACADAGIIFIGPSPVAIRSMGDKAAAKAIMEKAGVPVVPGYHGDDQADATLLAEAGKTGWPVLLKASAGGGGKGMRIVRASKEFADALASARRESKAAFGDDRMLVEKYIERPRHIEVQVFGDSHGNVVHLYERDCSLQRRHQKVVEEAPAPGVDAQWRAGICEAAVNAARAVDYSGAGTVEFIVESGPDGRPGGFWFMEMNTRLQVEHPVTEEITGTDLVEWQFRVASGEPLPLAQDDIQIDGHAMEVRLYAEDPARGFLPAPGRVSYFDMPWSAGLRVDAGIDDGGAVIPPDYDPMIAKVIYRGDSRAEALNGLARALGEIKIVGVATNAGFLSRILEQTDFQAGAVDTGFIERNSDRLMPSPEPAPDPVLALACLALLHQRHGVAARDALESADPWSPWARADGWRLNDIGHTVLRFIEDEREIDIACHFEGEGYRLDLPGGAARAAVHAPWDDLGSDGPVLIDDEIRAELDGMLLAATVVREGNILHVFHLGGHWRLGIYDPLVAAEAHEGAGGGLTAPMPGKVTALHVKAGDRVKAGQALIVVEAMKMEHAIHAATDGLVAEVRFGVGDQVAEGEILVVVADTADA